MSTDRELLELAAKALGINGEWVDNYGGGDYYYRGNEEGIYFEHEKGGSSVWNPLTDDGDALRLAATLRISIEFRDGGVKTKALGERLSGFHPIGADLFESVRRAIVREAVVVAQTNEMRAAAEIGRSMGEKP